MIVCQRVGKRVGARDVLSGVDLRIERGERVALLGLNGAGKTTLLRCILGLARFEGEIRVDGRSPGHVLARDRIAYVPQRAPRFDVSLASFLRWFADVRGIDVQRVERRAADFGLDIAEHGTKVLTDLSGGMLQKAVLAIALAASADLLLLDEPTANLDADSRARLLRALQDLEPSPTLVISSHRMSDLVAIADRAVVLEQGRVVFDGPMQDLWGEEREAGPLRLWQPDSDPAADMEARDRILRRIAGEENAR